MNIAEIPKRLVLILVAQMTGCAYCIFTVGAMAKGRRLGFPEFEHPVDQYIPWIKNFGWLLFLLPCIWFFAHVRLWWMRGADYSLLRSVVITGVATFVVILWCGAMWGAKAMEMSSLIMSSGE
jgi:hypothetical protein